MPYLKGHFIAFCWTGIIVAFPLLNSPNSPIFEMDLLAFYLLIFGTSIPFDIRDLQFDDPKQKTIPQVFGVKGAKAIAVLCVIVFLWLTFWKHPFLMTNAFFVISAFTLLLLIIISNEKRTEGFYSIGIDGALALIGASVLIGNAF